LISPATSSFAASVVVPIPTFPLDCDTTELAKVVLFFQTAMRPALPVPETAGVAWSLSAACWPKPNEDQRPANTINAIVDTDKSIRREFLISFSSMLKLIAARIRFDPGGIIASYYTSSAHFALSGELSNAG
jgi:hypothetical protein